LNQTWRKKRAERNAQLAIVPASKPPTVSSTVMEAGMAHSRKSDELVSVDGGMVAELISAVDRLNLSITILRVRLKRRNTSRISHEILCDVSVMDEVTLTIEVVAR
jgi:hypothetical protein